MPPPRSPRPACRSSRVKGESLFDYWEYTHKIFEWGDGGTPNLILDDGGDATLLIHLGMRAEAGDTAFLDKAGNEEEEVLFAAIKKRLAFNPGWYDEMRRRDQRRERRDDDRRPSALSHGERRQASLAGDQRQ